MVMQITVFKGWKLASKLRMKYMFRYVSREVIEMGVGEVWEKFDFRGIKMNDRNEG